MNRIQRRRKRMKRWLEFSRRWFKPGQVWRCTAFDEATKTVTYEARWPHQAITGRDIPSMQAAYLEELNEERRSIKAASPK